MKSAILFFITILIFQCYTANAQTLEREVIASSGKFLSNPNINLTLSCTVGEPIVATLSNVKLILTQGFQQPLENDVLGTSINYNTADWGIKAFPNPFSNYLNIEITTDVTKEFSITITNLLGQNFGTTYLANQYPGKNVYHVNTENLAQGMYIVTISSQDGILTKSFKLTNSR